MIGIGGAILFVLAVNAAVIGGIALIERRREARRRFEATFLAPAERRKGRRS